MTHEWVCDKCSWALHVQVRGPTYLRDHKKVPAGDSVFVLTAVDAVFTDGAVPHISRYLPSVR